MNKKRRRLTLAALAVFGLIIFFHYCDPWFHQGQLSFGVGGAWHGGRYHAGSIEPLIADVRMPLFALAVVYAGLFFLFGGTDAAPVPRCPRNWRRIIGLILALLLVAGGIAGIIDSYERKEAERQWNIESEKRKEATRQAKIEEEDSRHRITSSEIDLIDLHLEPISNPYGSYFLTGRIRNRAAHNRTLNSITLIVTLRERGSPDILGEQMVQIRVEVPSHQTRAIFVRTDFPNLPYLTQHAMTYDVTEIRGSKGKYDDLFEANAPSAAKYLGLTPTPSPKRGIYDDLVEEAKAKKKHGPDAAPTP